MKWFAPVVCLVLVVACVSQQATASPQGLRDYARGAYNSARNGVRGAINFGRGAVRGTGDMYRAYRDMREANWRNSDRYFHARGNRDAARHGAGGRFAASVISNARELTDRLRGGSAEASRRDQEANRWGRNGGDPNRYRPNGLPDRY